ncbi:MAG: hypothetical protein ACLFR2_08265 [Candidatus Kapaibacterium sp.]
MTDNDKIISIIYEAIEEINEELPKNRRVKKEPDTILFGEGGSIDSITLVNLIVTIEGLIEDEFDKSVTLADEKAMSQANSPFRSVASLADYTASLLEE